jgi:hypothetical protein
VSDLTPSQERLRGKIETGIGFFAPALDALLAVGDRISRTVEPEDYGYYPPRPLTEESSDPEPK